MQSFLRAAVLTAAFALLSVGIAAAHGDHEVGDYVVVFGWRSEPAYAGMFNGPEIYIETHDGAAAEVNAELQAEVTFGPVSTTVFFEPAFGETGHYIVDLIPTMPGDYTFHITGKIGTTAVDLTFDSADGEFSSVNPASDILFPAPDADATATIADLEARLTALEARLAALESE
jgi:hypothetical protein